MSTTARLVLVSTFLPFLAACNCGSTIEVKAKCSATVACPSGKVCVAQVCETPKDAGAQGDGGSADGGHDAGMQATLTTLTLEPATAMLTSVNGSKPTQPFAARMTFSDGTTQLASNAVFTNDQQPIGTVDAISGEFTASAQVGGTVTVTGLVMWGTQSRMATATVTVKLEHDVLGMGVTAADVTKFMGTPVVDAAREANVVYPLDNVLFPQNVAPADVQWLVAAAGDLVRVTIVKPSVKVVAYALADGNMHWEADPVSWRAIAQSDPAVAATLTVDRYQAATQQVISGTPRAMKFAKAALTGSIYYWDIAAGRIVRIDDGTTNRTSFMPSPPVDASGTDQCIGCHTVSKSGRYMAGRLGPGENIGGVFDLTANLTPNPAPTVWPTSPTTKKWWFSSFSPDETQLVLSLEEGGAGGMAFMDPQTGLPQNVVGTPTGKITHVAWSPDGKSIAYVSDINGWGGGSTTGNITTLPVLSPTMVGTPVTVHMGNAVAGATADSYPTWTPDAKKLGFANGTGNRSEDQTGSLFWMNPDGTNVERLTNASGGPTSTLNFQPRFSPFMADGYYWMSFLSRRDYGNAKVGTRGANRQQIWVAAVKVNPQAGDPSEAGYWLPGQNTQSKNIAAFWAPRACRAQGADCTVGSECCSDVCAANATGKLVCSPTPPARCRVQGESCGQTSDCCGNKGLQCTLNTCATGIN